MSIRLRLTLLYSVILALTLTGFSAMLYGWQSRSMRSHEERLVADAAHRFARDRQWDDGQLEGRQIEERRPEERELVSAVFHNRLRINMKLDCDPTIVYALKATDSYTGRLRYRDLEMDSPYNTYLYPGLPPGPIANPGRAALEAALYPADVEYLYFVSRNDGSHQFSRTYREHVNAVNQYQRRRAP